MNSLSIKAIYRPASFLRQGFLVTLSSVRVYAQKYFMTSFSLTCTSLNVVVYRYAYTKRTLL